MTKLVRCDACGANFDIESPGARKITSDDYEVLFVTCPNCRCRYQILTIDTELRGLIAKREAVDRKLVLAKQKQFTKKAIAEIEAERNKLIAEQKEKAKSLQAAGDDILATIGTVGRR